MKPEYLIERTCKMCRTYAERSAGEGVYKPLSVICGDPVVLEKCTKKVNGLELGRYKNWSLFYPDDMVCELFDEMNPKGRKHRECAISFDPEGTILNFEMRIVYPEVDDDEIRRVYEEIAGIKGGELGTRHISALHGSRIPGVDLTVAISEDAGTVIPFRNGEIIKKYVWIPDSKIISPALSL